MIACCDIRRPQPHTATPDARAVVFEAAEKKETMKLVRYDIDWNWNRDKTRERLTIKENNNKPVGGGPPAWRSLSLCSLGDRYERRQPQFAVNDEWVGQGGCAGIV